MRDSNAKLDPPMERSDQTLIVERRLAMLREATHLREEGTPSKPSRRSRAPVRA